MMLLWRMSVLLLLCRLVIGLVHVAEDVVVSVELLRSLLAQNERLQESTSVPVVDCQFADNLTINSDFAGPEKSVASR